MAALPDHIEISKQAIRERAVAFSKRWATATSEAADRQSFWNDFFLNIFDVPIRSAGFFEVAAKRLSTGNRGWIDLLVPGEMAVEHKSAGENLNAAMDQLIDYLDSLQAPAMPRLLVACDFQHFCWRDLETKAQGRFVLEDLSRNVELFWWLAGHQRQDAIEDEEEANLVATGYMAKLHDAVLSSGYDPHALRQWLTRILFCLFADDTEVWDRRAFAHYLFLNTKSDGSDLGPAIAYLFQILNTPNAARATNLDEDLAAFTYINGDLFADYLPIPSCDEATRTALLEACKFNWSAISPAIFGSMFQNVMTPAERRQLGAHYTTEENILRTIRPLFLDDLEAELEKAKSKRALDAFHDKLANLTFLDPACGCGNFLVIAYRELRRLETELLHKRAVATKQAGGQVMDVAQVCKITVGQFYGIEIEEFPARIARTALYLMDHKANLDVSKQFGQYFARFPIPTSPHIVICNALRMDWTDLLPAAQANYVFGNPPFGGHVTRTRNQSDDLRHVWGAGYAKWLDFVTGWYRKALDYGRAQRVRFAFVSTNSISQGEQVARLWQPLFDAGYQIDFAYQTFAWTSEAKGMAHVHVVIEGFSYGVGRTPRLFECATPRSEPKERMIRHISPYLIEGPSVVVAGRSTPISLAMVPVRYGSLPSDGGGLVVEPAEYPHDDPVAIRYLRRYVGSQELVSDEERWVIWMPDGPSPGDLDQSRFLRKRLDTVRQARESSKNPDSQALAAQPYRWFFNSQPDKPYVGIPAQVSETRRWYTVSRLSENVIASNTLYTAEDEEGFLFGILSSSMFMAWIRVVGGRLESRLRFSKSVVHNTFPLPPAPPEAQRKAVIKAGIGVLDARALYPTSSLADLYNPLATPHPLVRAHEGLDRAVDALFAPRRRFSSDADRLAFLFERYEVLYAAGRLVVSSTRRPRSR
jgi:hypothetical protein